MQAQQVFERTLAEEMVLGERQRARVLFMIAAGMALVGTLTITLASRVFNSLFNGHPPITQMVALVVIMLAYSALMWRIAQRAIGSGRTLPPALRYASTVIEMSLPTLILYSVIPIFGPVYSLEAVPYLLYYIFIILTALRLDFRVSVLAGIVGAVEYATLAVLLLRGIAADPTVPMLYNPIFHVGKGALLVMAGVLTGLVTREVRRQIHQSLDAVEDRNRVVGLFGQHVSPAVVERLLAVEADTDGEVRPVCIMFLDIRNFTAFCENKDPQEVVTFLNTLFAPLIEIVNRHHGIVNKFLGDGFMAVFGAPLAGGDPREDALHAALEIVRALDNDTASPPTRIGIGLHAGTAVTGTVGSAARKEYTIIGDVVNIAARIEQLNKEYGSQLLVSGAVWEAASDAMPAEALGLVTVRGHEAGVEIYRLA